MFVFHLVSQRTQQRLARKIPRRPDLTGFQYRPVAVVVIVVPAALMPVQRAENIFPQRRNL
jgi:hypothetical protein